MARRGRALTDHVERTDLRAYRRLGGCAHHFLTGANRRGPQLGLPLLLAARGGVDLAGVNARGLSRGSEIVAGMAAAHDRGQPRANANDLWRAWRTSAP